jgi:hypothetical protein
VVSAAERGEITAQKHFPPSLPNKTMSMRKLIWPNRGVPQNEAEAIKAAIGHWRVYSALLRPLCELFVNASRYSSWEFLQLPSALKNPLRRRAALFISVDLSPLS